jgi:hypothetical protein
LKIHLFASANVPAEPVSFVVFAKYAVMGSVPNAPDAIKRTKNALTPSPKNEAQNQVITSQTRT